MDFAQKFATWFLILKSLNKYHIENRYDSIFQMLAHYLLDPLAFFLYFDFGVLGFAFCILFFIKDVRYALETKKYYGARSATYIY